MTKEEIIQEQKEGRDQESHAEAEWQICQLHYSSTPYQQ